MGVLLIAAAVLAVILIAKWKTVSELVKDRYRQMHYVGKIPGPFSVPLLGTAWQFKLDIMEFTEQLRGWGEFYAQQGAGMLRIWIGPKPLVFIIKPETAKDVLESNELITKPAEYDILEQWLGTGLLISTGDKWRSRRKLLTPCFHFTILNDFMTTHNEQSRILLDQLELVEGKEVDMFPYIKRCALDIICETSMGTTVAAQTNHSHPYVMSVKRLNELSFIWQRMPWLKLKPLWYLSGYGYEHDKHLQEVKAFTRRVIKERIADSDGPTGEGDKKKKKVFLDLLIDMYHERKLDLEDIRDEVDTFMFEGHDTTSASIGWILWLISHNKGVQEKIHKEMDEIFGDSPRDCTSDDLKQMKYLGCCIKEGLRLFPSVPLFARRVEKDFMIDGTLIPKGVTVVVCPQMIHINPQVYDNPLDFIPERWIGPSERHPYAYIPFSAGPRNCIGQKFATMEEKTIISWILRRFSVSSSIPQMDNIPCPEIIVKPSLGFPMAVHRR